VTSEEHNIAEKKYKNHLRNYFVELKQFLIFIIDDNDNKLLAEVKIIHISFKILLDFDVIINSV